MIFSFLAVFFFLCVWAFVTFCSLTFNSHQRQDRISPYSIKTISNSLVMRIKTNIIQEIFSWPNTKFSESPRSSSERVKLLTSVRFHQFLKNVFCYSAVWSWLGTHRHGWTKSNKISQGRYNWIFIFPTSTSFSYLTYVVWVLFSCPHLLKLKVIYAFYIYIIYITNKQSFGN